MAEPRQGLGRWQRALAVGLAFAFVALLGVGLQALNVRQPAVLIGAVAILMIGAFRRRQLSRGKDRGTLRRYLGL